MGGGETAYGHVGTAIITGVRGLFALRSDLRVELWNAGVLGTWDRFAMGKRSCQRADTAFSSLRLYDKSDAGNFRGFDFM
jgi:hypothetical protein